MRLHVVDDSSALVRRRHLARADVKGSYAAIQRAFRNDTPNYLKQAEALSYAIRTAIDNELEQKDCMLYRAARVNKECIEATNAVFTGKPQPVIRRETLEAIDALAQMVGVKVKLVSTCSNVS